MYIWYGNVNKLYKRRIVSKVVESSLPNSWYHISHTMSHQSVASTWRNVNRKIVYSNFPNRLMMLWRQNAMTSDSGSNNVSAVHNTWRSIRRISNFSKSCDVKKKVFWIEWKQWIYNAYNIPRDTEKTPAPRNTQQNRACHRQCPHRGALTKALFLCQEFSWHLVLKIENLWTHIFYTVFFYVCWVKWRYFSSQVQVTRCHGFEFYVIILIVWTESDVIWCKQLLPMNNQNLNNWNDTLNNPVRIAHHG